MADRTSDPKIERRIESTRTRTENEWERFLGLKRRTHRKQLRESCIDRARLDIMNWLREQLSPPNHRNSLVEARSHGAMESGPAGSIPSAVNSSLSASETPTPTDSSTDAPEKQEPHDNGRDAGTHDDRGTFGVDPANRNAISDVTDSEVRELAELLASKVWSELQDDPEFTSRDVRKELALCHFWCDLFVALAVTLSAFQETLKKIPDSMKEVLRENLLQSPKHRTLRNRIGGHLVDRLTDRAWSALLAAAKNQVPILALLDSEHAVRSLRILAVVACPDPDQHVEVRTQALKPLEEDLVGVLTSETKKRLGEVFAEWSEYRPPER